MGSAKEPLIRHRGKSVYSIESLTRKAVITPKDDATGLKKCLTGLDLIAYGVGSTVGAGIFVTIGTVAHKTAGPAILFSFLSSGFACLLSAFCYAEFAARIPISGSAYSFSYVALGEFIGWFIGWNLTLEYSISASAVARGWASTVQALFQLFNVTLPSGLTGITLSESTYGSFISNWFSPSPLSVIIIILCTIILLMGVKDSAKFNLVVTVMNIATISFVVIYGAMHVNLDNWSPFFPYGAKGAFAGAGVVFFSYIGFDSVTTLAGEVARPSRDLPLGIVGTLFIATVLYTGVSLVVTGMVRYDQLNIDSPLTDAFESIGKKWAAIIVGFGGITALVASTLCSLMGQPRIYYQMGIDGLLPPRFAQINPKTQVPVFGTIVTAVSASILAFLLNLDALASMISIGTLLAFTVVCAGIIVLRCASPDGRSIIHPGWKGYFHVPLMLLIHFLNSVILSLAYRHDWAWWTLVAFSLPLLLMLVLFSLLPQPNIPTTFKCPFVPVLPLIGILVNTFLIVQLDADSIYRVIVWTAIGMLIYFGYGIRHSKLNAHGAAHGSAGSLNSIVAEDGKPHYGYVRVDN